MQTQAVIQKWNQKIPTINGWISLNNPFSAEIISHAPFDTLTIDMQHGVSDYATLIPMLQAIAKSHIPVFARVPWLEAGIVQKVLDAGVCGIIAPMINTKEDAQKLTTYCKYPPIGQRSFGPIRAKFVFEGDYFSLANQQILIFAMIETEEAIKNLDDILQEDISGIYIGPADLSASLGATPKFDQEDPKVLQAIAFILQKAKQYGKYAGIHNLSPSYAKKMQAMGFDFLTIGSDAFFMLDAAKKAIEAFWSL